MNLPNKLSLFRVVIIPLFVLVYYLIPSLEWMDYVLAPLFIIASLTDFLDGYIARKNNLVTVFGKFIDPLADKLLVMAALIILNAMQLLPYWVTIIILSREFIVTGIRLVAVGDGKVIAASKLGKYKTASTMVGIVLMLLIPYWPIFGDVGLWIVYVGCALTVISGIDYFVKNKHIIMQSM
ncbi:CDP-diacylglycerol--glycerol-3-phosphate 3-phosphatidyltransferase [Candidatus Xianfuyuplasma coldseepsis]|uniref:CDP-diacylglycerol--glycerol-3-phosphate 3-phosphatidyltransferase n=1 Tax=Candidatus Xianfuyuplasma coldseepsis TaxID=2782163 RepID=A0A7L7KSE3_9MOLU|nr:CDP-diacylglycerol--glycerol-3-phosphate 3-phosphatidyltransferase [Xianfuyuplasma coldseepsis]QMS85637.1 CDP-diacylglycerol--glycerol-3-phosphate 3-phosphatidyltransferase [Xianfuyuplasma coldseepsis]